MSLIWFVIFATECIRIRSSIGHWPQNVIDERDAGLIGSFHSQLSVKSFILLYYFVLPWIVSVFCILWARLDTGKSILVAMMLLSPAIFIIIFDPAGVFIWFLD